MARGVVLSVVLTWQIGVSSNGFAIEPPITDVAFAPDGKSLASVSQSGLHILSWPELQRLDTIQVLPANPRCVVFSPAGSLLAVGGGNPSVQGITQIFAWPAGETTAVFRSHGDSVTALCWRDAAHLFSAGLDRRIKLCGLEQRNVLRDYEGHSRGISSVSLLADGVTLVSVGHDQSVRVWDSSTGELLRNLSQHTSPIHAAALRPAVTGLPMVATAAADRTIRFWQPTIGRMVRYLRLECEPLDIAWTNDGSRLLAACVDGRVRVIDPVKVIVARNMPAIDGWAYAIAVHPTDGSIAVGGVEGQIQRIAVPTPNAAVITPKQSVGR